MNRDEAIGFLEVLEETHIPITIKAAKELVHKIWNTIEDRTCSSCKHFDGTDRCIGSLNVYVHDEWSCADWSKQDG